MALHRWAWWTNTAKPGETGKERDKKQGGGGSGCVVARRDGPAQDDGPPDQREGGIMHPARIFV